MRTHPWAAIPTITLTLLLGTARPGWAQQQEKGARDFAKLMPASSLVYIEMNHPKMVKEILTVIKGSALNDYAAFRDDLYKRLKIDAGGAGGLLSLPPSASAALVLTPELFDEISRIKGFAVAVTGGKAGREGLEPGYLWAIDPGTSNLVPLIVREICTIMSPMKSVRTVEGVRVNQWFQLDKRIEAARENIQKIQGAAKSYLRDHEKLDSLKDLVTSQPPLLRDKQILIDPWGKPYRLEVKDGQATVWSDSPLGKITSTTGPDKARYEPVGPVLAVMPELILVGSDADIVSDVIRREKGMHERVAAPVLADLPEFQQYADVRKNRQLFSFFNLARVESLVKANPVAAATMVEARTLLGLDSCKELAVGAWLERSNPHLELVARHDVRKPTPLARMLSTRTIDPRVLHFVPDDAFITMTAPLFKEPGDYPRFLESLQVVAARTKHASNGKKTASAPENPIQQLVRQIGIGLATPQGKELASSIHSITLAAAPGTTSGILANGILELKDEAAAKAFMEVAPILFGKGRKAKVQKIGKHTTYTVPVDGKGLETDLWGARFYWYWGELSYGRHGSIVVLAPSPEMVARALQGGATNGGFAVQPDVAKALTQARDTNGLVVWSGRNILKAGLKEAGRLSAEGELAEVMKQRDDKLRDALLPVLDQELLRHYPQQFKKLTADLTRVAQDLPAGLLTATVRPDRLTISGSQSGLQLALPRLIDAIFEWDLSRPNIAKLKQNLERRMYDRLDRNISEGLDEKPSPRGQEPRGFPPDRGGPSGDPRPSPGGAPPRSPPEPRKPEAYQLVFPSFDPIPEAPLQRHLRGASERQRRVVEFAMAQQQRLEIFPGHKELAAARDRVRQAATERDNLRARIAELETRSEKAERRVRAARDLLDSMKTFLDVESKENGSTTETAKRLRAEVMWAGSQLGSARRAADKPSTEIALHRKKIDELEETLKRAEADLKKVSEGFDRIARSASEKFTFRSLPISDGFSPPTKIQQGDLLLDLTIDYSFKGARSFDRSQRVQWEYRIVTSAEVRDLGKNNPGAGLNRLGDEGWELVGIDKSWYVLKRPK